MYCPKCGTENAEANKFCRACRENLGVISQAMKQRLPVVLASRFDQMLDSRSERFRRDSVICFLVVIISLIAGLSGSPTAIMHFVFFALFGVWSYLAYRRSLDPDFDWGDSNEETPNWKPFDKSGVILLNIGDDHTENAARTTDKMSS